MRGNQNFSDRNDHLKRLPREYYQGQAYVHWSLTIQDRKTGWLIPIFYYKFREILTHTAFRFGLCCPIYCCMSDHIHLLWIGILDKSDQLLAMRFLRRQMNHILQKLGFSLQREGYDHVLREEERERSAFEEIFEYVARNPERAGLVATDRFSEYPFTGCLVPGYPDLRIWDAEFGERFWRIHSYLAKHGLITGATSPPSGEGGYDGESSLD